MSIGVGDRVVDVNDNWPRCQQTGTVVSIKDSHIDWISDTDNEIVTDSVYDLEKINGQGTRMKGGSDKWPAGKGFPVVRDWLKYRYFAAIERRGSRVIGLAPKEHRMKISNPNKNKRRHRIISNRLLRINTNGEVLG